MDILRSPLRFGLMWIEGWFDHIFGQKWNPTYCLGALGYYYFWIVSISGVYVYIFFDTGIPEAFLSVEYLTNEQWWLGGIMRSLHRYASDAMVAMMVLHVIREFAFDRYRGGRWFSWITGIPMIWLIIIAGISGYWLVWDVLAQYVGEATTELLDWFPIFGEPIARNFLAASHIDGRFFTLMTFAHIFIPLILLFVMWLHLQRVAHSRINPPRGLAIGTFLMLLVLSLVKPATSQGIANLAVVPSPVGLDWFYLWVYPLTDLIGPGMVWAGLFGVTFLLFITPWLPPAKKVAPAVVSLDNCNGCTRCVVDCPFNAITMIRRSDGAAFEHEAVVDSDSCVACGICVGSCPTSTPFRRGENLIPGIDLPDLLLMSLRDKVETATAKLSGPVRLMVFGCDKALKVDKFRGTDIATISLPCAGMMPPSFIDYVLSKKLAHGVIVTGCRSGECHYRLGQVWLEERLDGKRDPRLRKRVPRNRVSRIWASAIDGSSFEKHMKTFKADIKELGPYSPEKTKNRDGVEQ